MTSWAAEISRDVSWAHAIAPKANITLVLAKSDNDAYAIADETAGYNLGFINMGLYHIGQAPPKYSSSFHDVTSGNNSFLGVSGFSAGPGWDLATGLGSPTAGQLVGYLLKAVSPGDGIAAIATTGPYTKGNVSAHGHMKPH